MTTRVHSMVTTALLALFALGGSAQAAIISVNLAGDAQVGPRNVTGNTGVFDAGNWNNFDNQNFANTTLQGLTVVDDGGVATAMVVSTSDSGGFAAWNNGAAFSKPFQ